MRRHRAIALALAGALLAGLLAAPVAPAAEGFGMLRKSYLVKTRAGKIYVEVVHPTRNGDIVKAPAVFTYSPYSMIGVGESLRRANDAEKWVPQGFARVWADLVGTGNSGGCFDYGGDREKKSAYDLVEWIAAQKWSTGKVGMFGGSYEGTAATAAAVMDPPHLTTIVPEVAVSRWYGYSYSGGMRYFLNSEKPDEEGFDTPLAFDFGLAVPPPLDATGEDWQTRFAENVTPCDEIAHTEHGYDETPNYDRFWIERDYLRDAGDIDIPVMVVHTWGDWNVKQEEGWNLFHALKNSPKAVMFFGDRYSGHERPGDAYERTLHEWMDHYLKGVRNNTPELPSIISETADYDGALELVTAPADFNARRHALIAQEATTTDPDDYPWKLLASDPVVESFPPRAEFAAAAVNAEGHANHHYMSNHDWFWFQTPPLKEDTRVFGEIKVKVRVSSSGRKWITMTPGIVDVDPSCHQMIAGQHHSDPRCLPRSLYSVTRGFLDSRYRNGLDEQDEVTPGAPISMKIQAKPIDYVFKRGHHIGLNLQTEMVEWVLPKPYPCDNSDADCARVRVHWEDGKTKLILPVVGGPRKTEDLFEYASHGGHDDHSGHVR